MDDYHQAEKTPKTVLQPSASKDEVYEEIHVHQVYEQIASHFSATRYKPWPVVESFLKSLPDGSIGTDVGCGNGKYLQVNPAIYIIASDRSQALAKIASNHEPHSSIVADGIELPHRTGLFDFAISIAVIHHFSSQERRVSAVRALLDVVRPQAIIGKPKTSFDLVDRNLEAGRVLIFVWALEQKKSRRGWDTGDDQDILVPWVLQNTRPQTDHKQPNPPSFGDQDIGSSRDSKHGLAINQDLGTPGKVGSGKNDSNTTTYQRFYHLFRQGELEACILDAGGIVLDSGYEKDNWWAIATRESKAA